LFIYIENDMAQKTKKFSLSPLGDRVVVRPSEKEGERKLASGIIIPETVDKEKLLKGEIISVGPGRRNDDGKHIPVGVKTGDIVFFKKPWDEPIKIETVEYYVLPESEIILIEN
ncbi:MAG: co-chaperone GroES, partial [Patescibacteria group bacterium]